MQLGQQHYHAVHAIVARALCADQAAKKVEDMQPMEYCPARRQTAGGLAIDKMGNCSRDDFSPTQMVGCCALNTNAATHGTQLNPVIHTCVKESAARTRRGVQF